MKDEEKTASILMFLIASLHAFEEDGDTQALERLRKQLVGLKDDLKAQVDSPTPFARSAAAELLFSGDEPKALYDTISDPAVEVTYALLDALARRPSSEAPLENLEFFENFEDHELLSLRILAGAGVWRAYRINAGH